MSNSHSDESKLLPGCWLESPWDPGTAGTISEQSHLIDLIPLYKAQWLRYFLFWAILVGGILALGALAPPALNAMNIPVPDLIKLGGTGLDRWLETILLFLTAGTSYLAWRIRRQKPECLTRGWILFISVGIFLYMSLDRTSHCAQSLTNSINAVLHNSLESGSVSLEPGNILYWKTAVYGIIYLAILSRLMIEFSGASMAQLFLLAATAAYACSCGLWFAPISLQLPLTIEYLSSALTLIGDFCLFWSLVNYTRFILLEGFGLDSEGWRTAINRYRYASRHSSKRNSYIQSETDSSSENSNVNSYSTEQTSNDINSTYNSPFAFDAPSQSETSKAYQDSQYSQAVSSVTTTSASAQEPPYSSSQFGQAPYISPYTQPPFNQQPNAQQQYNASPYNQSSPLQNSYEQNPFGQTPYNNSQAFGSAYNPQNPQQMHANPAYPTASVNGQPVNASFSNGTPPIPPRPNAAVPGNVNSPSAASPTMPTAEEVQKEFQILEEKIHRQLTHDEKKAVVRRMIRERQGK